MTGHLGVVRFLFINDERLVSGGDQKKIGIWNYRVGKTNVIKQVCFVLVLSCTVHVNVSEMIRICQKNI